MRRTPCLLICAALVAGVTGCGGIAGSWTLDKMRPAEAADAMTLVNATFTDDGTYTAELRMGSPPGSVSSAGEYTFQLGQLTLINETGRVIEYDAKLTGLFEEKLEISRDVGGRTVVAELKRR